MSCITSMKIIWPILSKQYEQTLISSSCFHQIGQETSLSWGFNHISWSLQWDPTHENLVRCLLLIRSKSLAEETRTTIGSSMLRCKDYLKPSLNAARSPLHPQCIYHKWRHTNNTWFKLTKFGRSEGLFWKREEEKLIVVEEAKL